MKKTQIDIIGGFLGEISQMDGERFLFGKCYNLFWGGGNLSHLSGHYHFRLVVENLVKSTKNLGMAQPSPLFLDARISITLSPGPRMALLCLIVMPSA